MALKTFLPDYLAAFLPENTMLICQTRNSLSHWTSVWLGGNLITEESNFLYNSLFGLWRMESTSANGWLVLARMKSIFLLKECNDFSLHILICLYPYILSPPLHFHNKTRKTDLQCTCFHLDDVFHKKTFSTENVLRPTNRAWQPDMLDERPHFFILHNNVYIWAKATWYM